MIVVVLVLENIKNKVHFLSTSIFVTYDMEFTIVVVVLVFVLIATTLVISASSRLLRVSLNKIRVS